jgi:hypothetical protein
MKTTVWKEVTHSELIIHADKKIDDLRRHIWAAIHAIVDKTDLPDSTVAWDLGTVQQELICHTGNKANDENNSVDYIWKAISANRADLSDCDVSLALGLVQYELLHHTKSSG